MLNKIKPIWQDNFSAIAINCSNEYVPYLSVCLKSLIDNASNSHNYDIIICEKYITEQNKKILKEFVSKKNVSIRFINIADFILEENFPEIFPGYSIESYTILYTPILFENYERILFTDCDLIFTKDIQELFHIDLEGKMACAVKDLTMSMLVNSDDKIWEKHVFEELHLKNVDEYFNSGVMVYDIRKCISQDFTQKTLEIAKYPQRIFIQGILNKFYQGKNIKYMDNKYNLDLIAEHEKYLYDKHMDDIHKNIYLKAFQSPNVLHWAGIRKPWFYPNENMAFLWWQIARKTPYYEIIIDRLLNKGLEDIFDKIKQLLFNTVNYRRNKLQYIKYKILSNITWGKMSKKYKTKKRQYKSKIHMIDNII